MDESILNILEVMRKDLPPDLIGEEGYNRLAAVSRMLPSDLTTFWGFECRLGEVETFADVLFEARALSRGQRVLAGLVPSSLDALCARGGTWESLRRFALLWAEPGHPFHNRIHNIWLEIDTAASYSPDGALQSLWNPSLFFGPAPAEEDTIDRLPLLVSDILAALGRPDTDLRALISLPALLPRGVRLFQIGLMLSRRSNGLRLVFSGLHPRDVCPWLSGLNWKGDYHTPEELLERLAPAVDSIAVGLDLDETGISGKVGIECYLDRPAGTEPLRWNALLDFLEGRGLCLSSKREGLLAYPGYSRSPLASRLSSDGIVFTDVFRTIHHLKVSIAGDRIQDAKAYLAVNRPGIRMGSLLAGRNRCDGNEEQGASRDPWLLE